MKYQIFINNLLRSRVFVLLLVFFAYFSFGNLGLKLSLPAGFSAPVWPAAGIAIFATLKWGHKVAIGIFLGSFLLEIKPLNDPMILVQFFIALGATLQAYIGRALVLKVIPNYPELKSYKDILRLLAVTGPVSCLVSASVAMSTLIFFGRLDYNNAIINWLTWYFGDSIGVLVILPTLIIFFTDATAKTRNQRLNFGLPIIFSTFVIISIFTHFNKSQREKIEFIHQNNIHQVSNNIINQIKSYEAVLDSIELFYKSSIEVTRNEFKKFTGPFLVKNPAIKALEFVPRIVDGERESFIKKMKAEGFANYSFTELDDNGKLKKAQKRSVYYPIAYLEPLKGNDMVLGYDLGSNLDRKKALSRSHKESSAILTTPIEIYRGDEKTLSTLYVKPIHTKSGGELKGFVVAVIEIHKMFANQFGMLNDLGYRYELNDIKEGKKVTLHTSDQPSDNSIQSKKYLENFWAGGRKWQLSLSPTKKIHLTNLGYLSWTVLFLGAIVSALLALFILVISLKNEALQSEVDERNLIELETSKLRQNFIKYSHDREILFRLILEQTLALTKSKYGMFSQIEFEGQHPKLENFIVGRNFNDEFTLDIESHYLKSFELKRKDSFFYKIINNKEFQIENKVGDDFDFEEFPLDYKHIQSLLVVPIYKGDESLGLFILCNKLDGYKLSQIQELKPFFETLSDILEMIKVGEVSLKNEQIAFLNSKLASIGLLAAGVGHEINNPLAIVHGNLQKLKKDLLQDSCNKEVLLQSIAKQEDGIERISAIVKSLETYARMDKNYDQRLNSHELILKTQVLVGNMYEKEGIHVDIQFEAENYFILGNIGKFQQVLMILLSNAKDALINSANPTITIRTENKNDNLVVSVIDNGAGICEDIQSKIFESFFTTKEIGKGTGLGLGVLHKIVSDMNGKVQVDSKLDFGSTFSLQFPYIEVEQSNITKTTDNNVLERKELSNNFFGSALIVDDEEGIRELLVYYLEELGLEIDEADDGDVALEKVQYKRYDYIFTDMKMPKVSGETFIREAKKLNIGNPKFFIVTGGVTTSNDHQEVERLMGLADGIIKKPFDEKIIIDAIESTFPHPRPSSSSENCASQIH